MNLAIQNGSTVQLEYTLKDNSGTLLDSNIGETPLTYVQGEQQIIPGLEKALHGMRAGDEKHVVVGPEGGYGDANPAATAKVRKESLPEGALTIGTQLMAKSSKGTTNLVRVKEIKGHTVVLDLNHPLAGKTLYFDVKILNVEAPAKKQSFS
jgi:FKBP-type peptidyl-prolyl cis-trans isomerase SlyD